MALRAQRLSVVAFTSWVCACNPQHAHELKPSVKPPPSQAASATISHALPTSKLPRESGIYYTFRVAADLAALDAEVCFVGPRPKRLIPPAAEAAALLRSARCEAGAIPVADGAFALDAIGDGQCLTYHVDLTGALDANDLRDGASLLGGDALLSPDWWLWAPDGGAVGPVFARFEANEGPRPELPWPHEQRGDYDRRIPASAFIWKAQGAFARRASRPLSLGDGARLDVTVLGAGFGDAEPALWSWLDTSARAVTSLLGTFPLKRAQVLLVADDHRRGSFGYALRGGGPSATMLMPTSPSEAALRDDWTAVHELFHFSHPPMATSESWFYEGLATYFTALARARAGITSKRYGWWELLDGFERGSKVGTGQTLREECKTMRQNHTYWRVYWSGAAMLLTIDVELRRRGHTLEELIAKFASTSPDESHMWTSEEVVHKLDALCACTIPSMVTARHLDQEAFPSTKALVTALGLEKRDHQSVDYVEHAPDSAIRRAIMNGD